MKKLTADQMESDQGRIYGRAPVPGARYELDGVFYDSRGCECLLPGQQAPEPEPEAPPPPELTEAEMKIQQFKDYLDTLTDDEDRQELRVWMQRNCDKQYHPNTGLPKLKAAALADYTAIVEAE